MAGGEDACILSSGLGSGGGAKDRLQRALVLGASSLDGGEGLPSRAAGDGTPVAGGKRRRVWGVGGREGVGLGGRWIRGRKCLFLP